MNQTQLKENIFGRAADLNLLNIGEEFPYFATAHFFALKETAQNDNNYNAIAAKTSLYFKNSFYLNHLLHELETSKENVSDTLTKTEKLAETTLDSNIVLGNAIPTETISETAINATAEQNIDTNATESELPAIKIVKESTTTETELSFEPLYTSDYFASQGIKLSSAVLANDKLGMQLKSFTSWLKTMKKAHPERLQTNNIMAEVAIQKQAENSNIEAEVYTEPMAEAYISQGKNIKAIEIYSKLSLMFPEKSAFFADKIKNLKK